ncbi:MAG: hypothetical protein JWR19_399 [Pedosphaera sp.]|nr:hypothetical protein [Pedosphaera sp.]
MFNTFRKLFGKRAEAAVDDPQPNQGAAQTSRSAAMRVDTQPRTARIETPVRNTAAVPPTISLPLRSILGRLPADLTARIRQMDVGEAEVFIPIQKVLSQLSQGAVKISFGELRQASPPGTFSPENDRDRVLVELPLHEILSRLNPSMLGRRSVQKHVEVPAEVAGPFGGQTRVIISNTPLKQPVTSPKSAPLPQAPVLNRAPVTPAAPPKPIAVPEAPIFKRNIIPAPAAPLPVESAPEAPIFKRATPPPAAPVKPLALPAEPIFKRPTAPAPATPVPVPMPAPEENIFKRATPAPAPAPVAPKAPPVYQPISMMPPPAPIPVPEPVEEVVEEPIAEPVAEFVEETVVEPVAEPVAEFVEEAAVEPVAETVAEFVEEAAVEPAPIPEPVLLAPVAESEPIRFTPTFAPAPRPTVSRETVFLTASLTDISGSWPDVVRDEVAKLNVSDATTALPFGLIEAAIKQGKMAFPWKMVRSWIKPPLPPALASPLDAILLELPLKVITPIFLSSLRAARPQKKISVDENIPNLFSSTPGAAPTPAPITATPATAAPPAPAPLAPDTNYYVWKETNDAPEVESIPVKKGPSPGTAFLQRYATPNEIVSKAAALDGVGGALIALPDGLLVASKIPVDMNADTLAAFLPQIFGRVSQSTRELRMGELNNLNFTVGQIPWKIFRVGAIYFAAFGIAGQSLPTAKLAGIAAELDRKAK